MGCVVIAPWRKDPLGDASCYLPTGKDPTGYG